MTKFYDAITDFIFVADQPENADVIFVPGGNYPDAAEYAAKLYGKGYAPYVLPSGKFSITKGRFELPEYPETVRRSETETGGSIKMGTETEKGRSIKPGAETEKGRSIKPGAETEKGGSIKPAYETEWEYLRAVLIHGGVPSSAILREDQATYTYQNAIFSAQVLRKSGIAVKKAILCCQAFHARRCLLYYQEQFPETQFFVCPVVTKNISRTNWMKTKSGIETVLGEVERCGSQFHEIMSMHMQGE